MTGDWRWTLQDVGDVLAQSDGDWHDGLEADVSVTNLGPVSGHEQRMTLELEADDGYHEIFHVAIVRAHRHATHPLVPTDPALEHDTTTGE